MRGSIKLCVLLAGMCAFAAPTAVRAADAVKAEDLPVKEVTVFKDGHAFVLHEGKMAADAGGEVVMDYLPRAVLGTFWVSPTDASVKLQSVVSGAKIVTQGRTALTTAELIEANAGKRIRVKDVGTNQFYEGTIVGVPQQSSEELAQTSAPGTAPQLPVKGQVVLLKMAEGVKAIPLASASLQEVTFLDEPAGTLDREEFRNMMTLKFGREEAKKSVGVGMMYVQRGIRWIPNYRIEIDGKGKAKVKLQATIINELKDLQDVKMNLVIGVPSFAFKDTVDPMSMQETVAQLGAAFGGGPAAQSQMGNFLNNAVMSQQVRMSEYDTRVGGGGGAGAADTIDLGPEVQGSNASEDLFVFSVDHVTLKKGQRMVIGVSSYELTYVDVYKLDLPFAPPNEAMRNLNSEQQLQIARLLSRPKVKHVIRMKNDASQPITTAPAMVTRDSQVMAQGMTTYTSTGGTCDVELTVAVEISASRSDTETSRTPKAIRVNGNDLERVDLTGKITILNRKKQTIDLEVTRSVLGKVTKAGQDGTIAQLGPQDWGDEAGNLPEWWHWNSWPWWWYSVNSVGRIKWDLKVQPDQKTDLDYEWSYYWCW